MEYSVSSLSKLTRITVRTLHHYDQIGLLKPSIRMSNGRRYYGVEQFLRLNEIIYFKKLGFSLKKIKSIFASKNYDKSAVLLSRKEEILKEIKRLQRFIRSIDLATVFYTGCKMDQKEVYEKFGALQHTMKEVEELSVKEFGKDTVSRAKEKLAALSEEELEDQIDRNNRLMENMIKAIEVTFQIVCLLKKYSWLRHCAWLI
ncbi:MAG: MerR family transcriptional regulator [Chlamydiales bacterium]|nr:MerR family transcriptional regulator [Chlamydiales bacterium]